MRYGPTDIVFFKNDPIKYYVITTCVPEDEEYEVQPLGAKYMDHMRRVSADDVIKVTNNHFLNFSGNDVIARLLINLSNQCRKCGELQINNISAQCPFGKCIRRLNPKDFLDMDYTGKAR